MLVIKSLCLFARCSCHRGFADACSVRFVFTDMHAALAIGALQMLDFVVYAALTTGALQVF